MSDGGCSRRVEYVVSLSHVPLHLSCSVMSQIGLGAHLQNLIAAGTWTGQEKEHHIGVRNIKAVQLALNSFYTESSEGPQF